MKATAKWTSPLEHESTNAFEVVGRYLMQAFKIERMVEAAISIYMQGPMHYSRGRLLMDGLRDHVVFRRKIDMLSAIINDAGATERYPDLLRSCRRVVEYRNRFAHRAFAIEIDDDGHPLAARFVKDQRDSEIRLDWDEHREREREAILADNLLADLISELLGDISNDVITGQARAGPDR
jgi:hypothetical protein